jgi:hypothetical protein
LAATPPPVWRLPSRDYVPILVNQVALLRRWLASHQDAEIPRFIGTHEVTFGCGRAWAVGMLRAIFT